MTVHYSLIVVMQHSRDDAEIYCIDPKPAMNYELRRCKEALVIENTTVNGGSDLVQEFLNRE